MVNTYMRIYRYDRFLLQHGNLRYQKNVPNSIRDIVFKIKIAIALCKYDFEIRIKFNGSIYR